METIEKEPEIKAPETEKKPKIVRNREVDKAAKELADDYVLPLPPGKTLTWDQTQEWLALLTPAMWNHLACYLYRLKPKIRRQLKDPNSPNYIDCIGEPFNLDYIISRHGGGKYQLQVIDTDSNRTGNNALLFRCHFDISDTLHLPILDFAELELDAKENKSYIAYLQIKGELGADGKPVTKAGAPAASSTASLSAKEVLDILGFANKMSADQQAAFRTQFAPADPLGKSIGDILLEKMKQDDPGRDWDRMMGFMERLNKPDNSMTPIITLLQSQITNSNEQRKTDMEMFKFMMESQRREGNPRSQFGEFREIIGFARELMGSGNGRRNSWDTGLEIAREVGLPALQTIGNMVTNIMALRGGGSPVAPGAPNARPMPPAAAFDPYRNPQATKQYASTLPQQPQATPGQGPIPPMPPPPQPAPAPEPSDVEGQLLLMMRQYGGLIVNHMNNGTPGYDFADYVAGLLGMGAHASMCAPGENTLVTVMMRVPEIAVFGESRVRQFVNEFINYQEFIDAAGEPASEEEQIEVVDAPPQPKFYRPPAKAQAGTRTTGA